jgi:hypothetical protein
MKTQYSCLALVLILVCPIASSQWVVTSPVIGVPDDMVGCLLVSGANLFVGAEGVLLSTDNGASWSEADSGFFGVYGGLAKSNGTSRTVSTLRGEDISCLVASGTNLFAGTAGGHVYLSTNTGTFWTAVDSGLPYPNQPVFSLAISGTNLFAGTGYWGEPGGGVFRSTDNGTSWTAVNAGSPKYPSDTTQYLSIHSLAVSGTNLFAGTGDDGVFLSTDNGASWTATGLTNTGVAALVFSGTSLFAGTSGGGVLLSTDNGTNWTAVDNGLTKNSFDGLIYVNALAISGTNLFAGTLGGVFLSTNNGSTWTPVNTGLTDSAVLALAVSGTNIFALVFSENTYGGFVWRRPLSEMITSVEPPTSESPREFLLSQNYPNPFNPSTTIRFELPKASQVTLTVYDVLGREVSVLVNERRDAGDYEVKFDGSNLASGVYFYRLQAGSYVNAKKLLLLR